MHLLHPVAQAVHHQAQGGGLAQVEAVAGAGEVQAAAAVLGLQPVVGGVVDAAQVQRRAQLAAFAGVVVDHVEDHLQPGAVQAAHHGLELVDRVALAIPGLGRKVGHGVVAPVVDQPQVAQALVVEESVDGQQLHRGDAQALQVGYRSVAGQASVGATLRLGHVRVLAGEAFDMQFVQHGLVGRDGGGAVVAPVEVVVHHHTFGHVGGVVGGVSAIVLQVVAQVLRAGAQRTLYGLGIGVEQQFGCIAAVTRLGQIGAVDAVAVQGARDAALQVAMPDAIGAGQRDTGLLLLTIGREQAQLHPLGHTGVQRKLRAGAVPGGAQGPGVSRGVK